jgi:hypothetical protein
MTNDAVKAIFIPDKVVSVYLFCFDGVIIILETVSLMKQTT